MKYTIALLMAVALTVAIGGCLVTGQTTLTQRVDAPAVTKTEVTRIPIDLNDEPDYKDNKDKIKSVDELSVVAILTNNRAEPAKARLYLSNDEGLTTVDEVEAEATLVFESPTVPASGKYKIGWADGFKYVQNRKTIEKEIFGDGIFQLYAIALGDATDLNVDVKAEIVITITVSE
jgi:hypothetical protein